MSVSRICVRNVIDSGITDVYTTMNTNITVPHGSTWSRTATLAVIVTGSAAVAAWLLAAVAHLSEHAVVVSVMVAAFVASWMFTSRPRFASHHLGRSTRSHRVTLVPVHQRAR